MLEVIGVGSTTHLMMSVRATLRLKLLPFDLQTPIVSLSHTILLHLQLTLLIDANQFKEAFLKAQKENEALLKADKEA